MEKTEDRFFAEEFGNTVDIVWRIFSGQFFVRLVQDFRVTGSLVHMLVVDMFFDYSVF